MTDYRPFRKNRSYSLAAIIILAALFVSFSSYRDLFGVRSLLNSSFYPFQFIARAGWQGVMALPAATINLGGLAKENGELKEKLSAALAKQALYENLAAENQKLHSALGFSQSGRFDSRLLPARVIGRGAANWNSVLQIDKGSSAGVKVGMPAIVQDGLVGKVTEVSQLTAKVLLVIDPVSEVAVADQRSRDIGLAEGNGSNQLKLKYVNADGDVQVGDKVMTSSISAVFPPGIAVGTVRSVDKKDFDLFYAIKVKPAVNFSRLEEVFLVF